MSPNSTSRTSIFRRGLVVLATAATLLAGGLVAAPAAQAALQLVDTSKRDGTVVTTRMNAGGALIEANMGTKKVNPVRFSYDVDLGWTGGKLRAFDGVVTLQQVGAKRVRTYPVTVDADGDRHQRISLPVTISPGAYRVGIEFAAAVERPDGTLNLHRVDVDNAKKILVQRQTRTTAKITNPKAADGRPSRITGQVQAIRVSRDGSFSWSTLRSGTVRLSFDSDGPYAGSKKPVHVRDLTIRRNGEFSTVVRARQGWWELGYAGANRLARDLIVLPQGDHSGCGC